MHKLTSDIRGVIYLSLIGIAVLVSLLYGNMLDANIGEFPQYTVFGATLHISLIVLIPILITILYGYIIYLGKKYHLIKMSVYHFCFIMILLIMMIYMGTLIMTKDYTPYLGSEIEGSNILVGLSPTINERLWSLFSFYLSLTNIYAFFVLIKPVKHYKGFFYFILTLLILFCFSAIIYSLIVEHDKMALFKDFSVIYNKEAWLDSFFGHTNVFGHLLFFGVLSFVALAFLTKKYIRILPSFLFTPFIVFSASRAAMMSTFIVYVSFFIYLYVRIYFKKKWIFYVISLLIFALFVILLVDGLIYNFIRLPINDNETISIYDLLYDVFISLVTKRFNLIETILPIYRTIDYIFGFGYGISFLLCRTYNDQAYYIHNSFFEIYFQGGVPYVIFLMAFYVYVLYRVIRYTKKIKSFKILGLFFVSSLSIFFYSLYESMPIFFNDFLGGAASLFLLVLPLIYISEEENGYIELNIARYKEISSKKILYITDLYNEEKLKKSFRKNIDITYLQESLLSKLPSLDLPHNQEIKIIIRKDIENEEDGSIKKITYEYTHDDRILIFYIYI